MKKIPVFVTAFAVCVLVLLISGCTKKKASYVDSGNKEESQSDTVNEETSEYESENISESESQEPEEYRSLIEKYVGEAGETYRAYDEIVKWDSYFGTIDCMYPKEEWVDSDGRLKLPFDPKSVLYEGSTSYASYYVPDELAVKASTKELVDICLTYYDSTIGFPAIIVHHSLDYPFEWWISHSNSMEESLRRDDFAGEYFERYMEEPIPEYYDGMSDEEYFEGVSKELMLDIIEVILSQPEACEQLAEEQRTELVRRIIEKAILADEGKIFDDFASLVDYPVFFESITEENVWYDAINDMDLTEDERKVIDKYFNDNEQD